MGSAQGEPNHGREDHSEALFVRSVPQEDGIAGGVIAFVNVSFEFVIVFQQWM